MCSAVEQLRPVPNDPFVNSSKHAVKAVSRKFRIDNGALQVWQGFPPNCVAADRWLKSIADVVINVVMRVP